MKDFLKEYPIISVLAVLMAYGLVGFATYYVFTNMSEVSGAVATCYSTLAGGISTAIAFYQWRMGEAEKKVKAELNKKIQELTNQDS